MKKGLVSKICAVFFLLLIISSIVTYFVLPSFIDRKITKELLSRSTLSNDNFNLWGKIPGDLGLNFTTSYYLFNLTNPEEVLYFNSSPVFEEIGPFVYQQEQQLTDVQYEEDGKTVKFNQWTYWKSLPNTNDDINITTLNIGALGAWNNMKLAEKPIIALQVLYNLFAALEKDMLYIGYTQGVYQQYKGNESNIQASILQPAGIPERKGSWIFNDEVFGWKEVNNIRPWIEAGVNGVNSEASLLLRNYFQLSQSEMSKLLNGKLQDMISLANNILTQKYECLEPRCNGTYLTALQWSRQGVTNDPPAGGEKQFSIMTGNKTGEGFPEISAFLTAVFLKKINDSQIYQDIEFGIDYTYKIFNITKGKDGSNNQNWDTMLHIGNLRDVFEIGEKFDETKNLEDFAPIKERFGFESLYHVHVFWEYLRYLVDVFVVKAEVNDNPGIAILGVFASRNLYGSFVKIQDYLLPHLTSQMVQARLNENKLNCSQTLLKSIQALTGQQAQQICEGDPLLKAWNLTTIEKLVKSCWIDYGPDWKYFTENSLLNYNQMVNLCYKKNQKTSFFGFLVDDTDNYLKNFYQCQDYQIRCNSYEIALRQLASSDVTQKIPPLLKDILPETLTLSDWNKKEFPKPVEYLAFITKYRSILEKYTEIKGIEYDNAKKLMSFNGLFSALMSARAFNTAKNPSMGNFKELFFFDRPEPLLYYLRYFMLEIGLGGFTKTKTAKEHLWGYEDEFMKSIQETNPLDGGDPSLNPVIQLAQNKTYQDALSNTFKIYTGQDDVNKFRKIITYNSDIEVKANSTFFDGNKTTYKLFYPWKEITKIDGVDTFQAQPKFDVKKSLKIYLPQLYRSFEVINIGEEYDYSGMNTHRFKITNKTYQNKTLNPDNDKYYHDKWNGVMNMTQPLRFPIFISKGRLLYADKDVQDSVKIYKNGKLVKADIIENEDIFDIEPYTGAVFKARQNIQLISDDLVARNVSQLFPMFNSISQTQLSESKINELYSDLRFIIKFKKNIPLFCLIGLVNSLIFFILCLYLIKRSQPKQYLKSTKVEDDLLNLKIDLLQETPAPKPEEKI